MLTHLFKKVFLLRSGRKRRTLGATVFNRCFNRCIFKFYSAFYLIPTKDAVTKKDRQPRTSKDWVVSKHKHFRASIIVWGMPKDLTTLETRAKLADQGLASFVRGNVRWEGDHVRLVLTTKDSKGLSKELVSQVSSSLRKIGGRCVLDDDIRDPSLCM